MLHLFAGFFSHFGPENSFFKKTDTDYKNIRNYVLLTLTML